MREKYIVEWSREDQCYIGRAPGLMYGGVHGDDPRKVYKELLVAARECRRIIQNPKRKVVGRQSARRRRFIRRRRAS